MKKDLFTIVIRRENGTLSVIREKGTIAELPQIIGDQLFKRRIDEGSIESIKHGNKKIDDHKYQRLIKSYVPPEMKRHETIVPDVILDAYEKRVKQLGISARAQTALLIGDFVDTQEDEGRISLSNWRNGRLVEMLNHANGLSGGIVEYISEAIDHEGNLSIYWKVSPSIHDMRIIEQAWGKCSESVIEGHYNPLYERISEWDEYIKERESIMPMPESA